MKLNMIKNFTLILILLSNFKIANTKIIYDKNDIIITEIEIQNYLKTHKNYTNEELSSNIAVKNIYLMKKSLKRLTTRSPEYINNLDSIITKEFGLEVFNSEIHRDYLRFFKFRNEFIINYFNNNLSENDIRIIFKDIGKLPLQLSTNNCQTVDNILDLSSNDSFIKIFYENLKTNSEEYNIFIEDINYSICINKKEFKFLEKKIIDYIEIITEKEFNKFIYND